MEGEEGRPPSQTPPNFVPSASQPSFPPSHAGFGFQAGEGVLISVKAARPVRRVFFSSPLCPSSIEASFMELTMPALLSWTIHHPSVGLEVCSLLL
jgi:hypothetical protein